MATSSLPPPVLGPIHGEVTVDIARAGMLDGICAWFDAELAPGVRMTNAPGDPGRIDRRQVSTRSSGRFASSQATRSPYRCPCCTPSMVNWGVAVADGRRRGRSDLLP